MQRPLAPRVLSGRPRGDSSCSLALKPWSLALLLVLATVLQLPGALLPTRLLAPRSELALTSGRRFVVAMVVELPRELEAPLVALAVGTVLERLLS